jgi:hypothetical protein
MKFIFPAIWITGFGIGTIMMWGSELGSNSPDLDESRWVFLFAWLAGSAFIYFTCCGLKRVQIDTHNLYVSNYFRELKIPFGKISEVTENRWINIHPVPIRFKADMGFGEAITFMPTSRMFGFWSAHPVVAELRRLAHVAGT